MREIKQSKYLCLGLCFDRKEPGVYLLVEIDRSTKCKNIPSGERKSGERSSVTSREQSYLNT